MSHQGHSQGDRANYVRTADAIELVSEYMLLDTNSIYKRQSCRIVKLK